jgi:hypothetical protein
VNQDPSSRPVNLPEFRLPDTLWHDKDTTRIMLLGRVWLSMTHPSLHLSSTAQVRLHPITMSLQPAGKNNTTQSRQQDNTVLRMLPGHRLHCQKGKLTPGISPTSFPRCRHTKHNHLTFPTTILSRRGLIHISQVPSGRTATERNLTIRLGRWSKAGIDTLVISQWGMSSGYLVTLMTSRIPGLWIFPVYPWLNSTIHGRLMKCLFLNHDIHNFTVRLLRHLSPNFSYLESSTVKSMKMIDDEDE